MTVEDFTNALNMYDVLLCLSEICFSTVIILQMTEMFAMRYIIVTQKDRKVEEILFDHEHEDLQNSEYRRPKRGKSLSTQRALTEMFSFEDIQYRRRELRLKKWLGRGLYAFVLVYSAWTGLYTAYHYESRPGKAWTAIYDGALLAFGVLRLALYTFNIAITVNVYFLMKRLHQFEFNRTKRNMQLILGFYFVPLCVMVIVYVALLAPSFQDSRGFQLLWMANYTL
jgi:hypothetical protein